MSERSFEEQLKREDLAQERRRQEVCDYDMLSSSRTAAPFPEASSVPNVCPAYKGDHCGLQALNEYEHGKDWQPEHCCYAPLFHALTEAPEEHQAAAMYVDRYEKLSAAVAVFARVVSSALGFLTDANRE